MNRSFVGRWGRLISLLAVLLAPLAWAAIDPHDFETDEQRARYNRLADELRCPLCKNSNLSGTNSQIAEDLRRELHRMVMAGKSDEEITDFMVSRYGDFILYRPRFTGTNLMLWMLPFMLLIVGAGVVYAIVRSRRRAAQQVSALTEAERARLDQLLR